MNVVALFRVDDRNDHRTEKAQGHEPLLSIRQPIVLVGVRDAIEHLFSNPCLFKLVRRLTSCQVITWRVYTRPAYTSSRVPRGVRGGLTYAFFTPCTCFCGGARRCVPRVCCFSEALLRLLGGIEEGVGFGYFGAGIPMLARSAALAACITA